MSEKDKGRTDPRKARLAEQLRANLKRRKEQSRGRRSPEKPERPEPGAREPVSR
ncbi:MAG: hypothetical protein ACXIVF_13780 [Rhizobiaceae bacterium]